MPLLRRFLARLRAFVVPSAAERELTREVSSHVSMLEDDFRRQGLSLPAARAAALRAMGGVEQVKELHRDARSFAWLDDARRDLSHGWRALMRDRAFATVAILTTAIGIGANTAVFSVVNGIVIKPLPFSRADELVGVWHDAPGLNLTHMSIAPSLYVTYRANNHVFQDIGLWDDGTASVTGALQPEQVETLLVTDGTLSVLGVAPALGRRFITDDGRDGSADTVMLTDDYWRSRFAGDPSVIGRQLTVGGRPREVIGVLPRGFRFLNQKPALLLPLKFAPSSFILGYFNYQAVARLKPGVTLVEAHADVARMLPIWMASYPTAPGYSRALFEDARMTPRLRPLKDDAVGDVGSVLWIVMATLGVVLLIACANVANLLLVRAEGRRQELAVRVALGAGRSRIARGLLIESLLLGVVGGLAGLVVATGALRVLALLAPTQLPRLEEISIDRTVLLFTLLIAVFSGVVFGLAPVFKYARLHGGAALQSGSRSQTASRDRHRARGALVVLQLALALVLLISAGLIVRTFVALRAVHPGFQRPEAVQTLRIVIPQAAAKESAEVVQAQHAIVDRLAAIPGVTDVSFAQSVPLDGRTDGDPIVAEGADEARQMVTLRRYNFVGPDFFRTLGAPVLSGRDLSWDDLTNRRAVALVSLNLARELWGSPSAAVGKRVRPSAAGPWWEVIGVVGDIRDEGTHKNAPSIVYFPVLVDDFLGESTIVKRNVAFAVRSDRAGTDALMQDIRRAVWAVNKDLPVADVRTLADLHDRSMARTSFTLVMLSIAGGMALLLGLVGVYAAMSSSVSQRTKEMGIRLALGARHTQVMASVHADSMKLTAIGTIIGLACAAAVTRVLSGVLFGVTPLDPVTFVVVPLVLAAVSVLATQIPARRAARLDPMTAIRQE